MKKASPKKAVSKAAQKAAIARHDKKVSGAQELLASLGYKCTLATSTQDQSAGRESREVDSSPIPPACESMEYAPPPSPFYRSKTVFVRFGDILVPGEIVATATDRFSEETYTVSPAIGGAPLIDNCHAGQLVARDAVAMPSVAEARIESALQANVQTAQNVLACGGGIPAAYLRRA